MKIIERKTPKTAWPREIVCGQGAEDEWDLHYHCGSLLEVSVEDVTLERVDFDDIGRFTCPVCDRTTYLTNLQTKDVKAAL